MGMHRNFKIFPCSTVHFHTDLMKFASSSKSTIKCAAQSCESKVSLVRLAPRQVCSGLQPKCLKQPGSLSLFFPKK